MTTVLVCGGRNYSDKMKLGRTLYDFHMSAKGPITKLVHGAASGADSLAGAWAEGRNIEQCIYPANWIEHGRSAGPKRNALMLREEAVDVVIAFPGGRGTDDMKARARRQKIEVVEVE